MPKKKKIPIFASVNPAIYISALLFLGAAAAAALPGYPRKVTTRIVSPKERRVDEKSAEIRVRRGEDAAGISLSAVRFAGYDKAASSDVESFFVENSSGRVLLSVTVEIDYFTPDSIRLHSRMEKIQCGILPGGTKAVDIRSWDRQKSFHYEKSRDSRRGTQPYRVLFRPVEATFGGEDKASRD